MYSHPGIKNIEATLIHGESSRNVRLFLSRDTTSRTISLEYYADRSRAKAIKVKVKL
jgi:hypothetical protein